MVKGFKKKNGKGGHDFIPTDKKTVRSSEPSTEVNIEIENNSEEFSEGVRKDFEKRVKEIPIYKLDEADESLKEKIIEKFRNSKYEFGDNYFADDDGILYDSESKPHFEGYNIFKNVTPKYYEVGGNRGNDYIQFDLELNDNDAGKKLADYLGVKDLFDKKIDFNFINNREHNTKLIIVDVYGNEIDLDEGYNNYKKFELEDRFEKLDKEDVLTERDFSRLTKSIEIWDDLMDKSLNNLRNNYEYQFTDEAIIEDIRANDYDFDEDGNIA
mgnify:CR=1 FL=1